MDLIDFKMLEVAREWEAMLAPGSVLQPFSYIPPGQVWAGNPARYVRDVEEDEKQFIRDTAQESHDLGNAHADEYALEYPMVSTSDAAAAELTR